MYDMLAEEFNGKWPWPTFQGHSGKSVEIAVLVLALHGLSTGLWDFVSTPKAMNIGSTTVTYQSTLIATRWGCWPMSYGIRIRRQLVMLQYFVKVIWRLSKLCIFHFTLFHLLLRVHYFYEWPMLPGIKNLNFEVTLTYFSSHSPLNFYYSSWLLLFAFKCNCTHVPITTGEFFPYGGVDLDLFFQGHIVVLTLTRQHWSFFS